MWGCNLHLWKCFLMGMSFFICHGPMSLSSFPEFLFHLLEGVSNFRLHVKPFQTEFHGDLLLVDYTVKWTIVNLRQSLRVTFSLFFWKEKIFIIPLLQWKVKNSKVNTCRCWFGIYPGGWVSTLRDFQPTNIESNPPLRHPTTCHIGPLIGVRCKIAIQNKVAILTPQTGQTGKKRQKGRESFTFRSWEPSV